MVTPSLTQWIYVGVIALVALERLYELRLSHRNVAAALSRGGVEYGRGHFPAMTALHTALLLACPLEVLLLQRPFFTPLAIACLALALGAQALRYWVIATLGERWNVRVVLVPGEHAIGRGPFRFLRHPNYLAVAIEGIVLPMMHGAWITALAFSLLNTWLLTLRIRCEEHALREHARYDDVFALEPGKEGTP